MDNYTENVCCPNCGFNLDLAERGANGELDFASDELQSVVCDCGADLILYRIWRVKENG